MRRSAPDQFVACHFPLIGGVAGQEHPRHRDPPGCEFMSETILEVENLTTEFATPRGPLRAVDRVSFSLDKGKALGVVGESGSGKSVTARSIMRLLPAEQVFSHGAARSTASR